MVSGSADTATCSAPASGKEKTALLFVGQGAQSVGMTQQQLDMPAVRDMYNKAEQVLGYDLKKIVLEGPDTLLQETKHCQPALLIAGLAAAEQLKVDDADAVQRCRAVAGLSLGEYTALVHAGAMSFEDAIKVVGARAAAMQQAATEQQGKMTTVIGMADSSLEGACADAAKTTGEVVRVSNYLFPQGRVIAGSPAGVDTAKAALVGKAKIVKDLAVSGAFHTSLMGPAKKAVADALKDAKITMPTIPVIANTTGKAYTSPEEIRVELAKQVVEPVLWEASINYIISEGIESLYDMGPRATIKAMIRKINPKLAKKCVSVNV